MHQNPWIDLSDLYPYVLDVANNKDAHWQSTPGAFYYKISLPEKYLGVSEPEDVQAFVFNWDNFMETARKLNSESNGETKIVSGF